MTLRPGSQLYTSLWRQGLMWAWSLHIGNDEQMKLIAHGATWRKKNAVAAAHSWRRVWMRRHGLLY